MAEFNKSWQFLKQWEGGFVDHPIDPGGATNHGISLRWYKNAVDSTATVATIRDLTEKQARELIKKRWWDNKLFYAIKSQEIADRYFGFVYNMGPRNATRVLQRAVNGTENTPTVVRVDGLLGPRTIEAVNANYPAHLLDSLRQEAWNYYKRLVERRPELGVFKRGWRRRAFA